MTDELQHDRLQQGGHEPFTGFRFAPPVFTDAPQPDSPSTSGPAQAAESGVPGAPGASTPLLPRPVADSTAQPLAATFALDRRPRQKQRSTSVLDWVAFALAFLAPPIGLLAGIVAVIVSVRGRGWAAGIAKAAIGIGLALSVVLTGGVLVLSKNAGATAAHQAIVADSAQWCSAIQKDPTRLKSDTFGWPAIGGSIASSLPAMQAYTDFWTGLVKIAPAGIKVDTQKIASAASKITVGVTTSRVLDDSSNVDQMQRVVSSSNIPAWVSNYCN